MKRGMVLSLFLCSLLWGQWQLPPRQKPMLGVQLDWSDPINTGLVGYWLLNEGAGSILNDLSGNGLSLTKGALAVWSGSSQGPCLSRTGTSQPLASGAVAPHVVLTNASDFSLVFYGLVGAHSITAFSITADASISSIDTSFYYYSSGGVDRIYFYTTGSSSVYTRVDGTTPQYVGTERLVVATYKGATNTRTLYVDGVQVAQTSSDPGTKTSTGLISLANSNGWAGYASVYRRVLSSGEIARLYREPFAGVRIDPYDMWQAALPGGGIKIPVFMHHYQMLNLN